MLPHERGKHNLLESMTEGAYITNVNNDAVNH